MKILRRLAFAGACAIGLDRVARRRNRRRLLIVCYHGVARRTDPRHWLLMPPAEFERQLAFLAAHYRVVPIDQALAELRAGLITSPTACVTFDDGYRDNLTEALPRLQRAGVPATVYLATGLVGTSRRLWTTEIDLACAATRVGQIAVDGVIAPTAVPADPPGRTRLADQLKAVLKGVPAARRRELHGPVLRALGADAFADGGAFEIMSWSDVRQMEAAGTVTFGGHTINHEIVSRLDDAELADEIGGSMREVAARAARLSSTFAYPNGTAADFDARAAAAVAAAGGTAAVTTIEGLNGPDTDPFALRRVTLGADVSFDEFRVRISGLRRGREP
jgi:peptidoglycan/xylan/chitin deacetylase (PgdA/CDA1 family)